MAFYYQGGGNPLFTMGTKELIKTTFKNGSAITRLIYINIGVYLATKVGMLLTFLVGGSIKDYFSVLNQYLDLPGSEADFLAVPWTALTYMFTHYGFFHLLFNVLLLFWFGRALKERLSNTNLTLLYIGGGLAGAAFYLYVAPNLGIVTSNLAGGSASIMAIIAARCISGWRESISLLLLGSIKNIYVLLFILGFELLQLTAPMTAGSTIVHLGGAALGVIVGIIMLVIEPKSREPKEGELQWERGAANMNDWEYNAKKRENEDRVNEILDKVSTSGYDSLTIEEKNILFKSGQG